MKKQLIFEKIISIATLIACALCFFYSLSFMTGAYNLLYPFSRENGKPKVEGANLFYEFQPFNKTLTILCLVGICLSLMIFITQTHVRRKYYTANYVCSSIVAVYNIGLSVWAVTSILAMKSLYVNTVDWDKLKYYVEDVYDSIVYTESTIWFDLSIVAFGMLVIVSILLVGNLIWKNSLIKRENKLLADCGKEA